MILEDDQIVVLATLHGAHRWFASYKDVWVLDYEKWERTFLDAGYDTGDEAHTSRFGIAIVNEATASRFLGLLEDDLYEQHQLGSLLTVDGEVALPGLWVDFDKRHVYVGAVESPAFEDFLPEGWSASFEDLTVKVPQGLRYWNGSG